MNRVRNLIIYGMCAAIVVVSKEIIAFVPGAELVSFLLILFGINFKLKGSIIIAVVFSFLQMVLYGVGIWTYMYFIVWTSLVVIAYCCRGILKDEYKLAIFSGIFGLVFGFLFSIPYFVISFRMGWIYFVKGIPFDLAHGVGNYIIMLLLYSKCNRVIVQLKERYKV